jgi:hypothetical protein
MMISDTGIVVAIPVRGNRAGAGGLAQLGWLKAGTAAEAPILNCFRAAENSRALPISRLLMLKDNDIAGARGFADRRH